MKLFRLLTAAVSAALFISAASPALGAGIYDLTEETTVATGITHKNIRRLTSVGWQNINVIEADLTSGRYGVKTLTNPENLSKLTNVQALAEAHGTLAAVNGDFFSWKWNDRSEGSSVGVAIENGQLLTSASNDRSFSTVAQKGDGGFIFDYIDCSISVTTPDGAVTPIEHINKYDDLTKPVIYTSAWKAPSIGSTGTQVEIVVENNVVTSINYDMGQVEIPENGYIIAFLTDHSPHLINSFRVGDTAELNISYSPAFENISFAAGAGTILLKNGQPAPITHDIAGNHPRTAIGVNADESKLYLVTVDGRQDTAKGVTLEAFADILAELGLYNAANLDGGGSTTLVVSSPEKGGQIVENNTSDSYLRPVANGIGVVPAAPADENGFITINPDTDTVFLGTSTYLNPIVHDSLGNIIEDAEITWITADGTVADGYYTPHSAGMQTVNAAWNGITASKDIRVSAIPVTLETGLKEYSIDVGGSAYVSLIATDKNGYKSYINLKDTDISISSHILQLNGNSFIGREPGTAVVTFGFNGLQTSAVIRVGGDLSIASIPEDISRPFMDGFTGDRNGAFRFAVFGSTSDKSTLLKNLVVKRYTDILNSGICDAAVFTDFGAPAPKGISADVLNLSGFNAYYYDDAVIVAMDNGNFTHWAHFIEVLDNITTKNVFVMLPESVNDDSAFQEQLLIDMAEKRGIKLHIISGGDGKILGDTGVIHISAPGLEAINSAGSVVSDASYKLFTVSNGAVYCDTVNIFNYR